MRYCVMKRVQNIVSEWGPSCQLFQDNAPVWLGCPNTAPSARCPQLSSWRWRWPMLPSWWWVLQWRCTRLLLRGPAGGILGRGHPRSRVSLREGKQFAGHRYLLSMTNCKNKSESLFNLTHPPFSSQAIYKSQFWKLGKMAALCARWICDRHEGEVWKVSRERIHVLDPPLGWG